jgi:hypothetical protein
MKKNVLSDYWKSLIFQQESIQIIELLSTHSELSGHRIVSSFSFLFLRLFCIYFVIVKLDNRPIVPRDANISPEQLEDIEYLLDDIFVGDPRYRSSASGCLESDWFATLRK